MNATRVLTLVAVSVPLLAAPSPACTNIYGIPGECRMRVLVCDVSGSVPGAPAEVSSVDMSRYWTHSAGAPSPDGAVNVLNVSAGLIEVHYRGRRRSIPRGPYSGAHAAEWDSSQRRFAFWAPAAPGVGKRLAVCDVRTMSSSSPFQVVYTAPTDRAPFGAVWVPDRDELLVIERGLRVEDGASLGVLVKVDVATGATRDLVVEDGALDFVVTQQHRASAGAAPVALVGSLHGLKVLDCVTGALQVVRGVPAVGIYNVELSPDGRRAAVFYRRAVPVADGRLFVGVYLLDLEALVAGEATGATQQLYDGTDVHTLWLSPAADEVLWATPRGVWRQRVEPGAAAQQLAVVAGDREEVKGAAYDPSGARVAVTLGARLVVHDLVTGATTEAARFGEGLRGFAAEPRWVNGKVMVSVFEDVAQARGPR